MILKRKLLLAINPHAGKSAMKNKLMSVVQRFTQGGYEVTVFTTQRAGQLPEYIRENAERFDLVVCSGGDGTMSETVNGLMHCENPPRLGYIPAGSTNDYARSLGLSTSILTAARDAVCGSARARLSGTKTGSARLPPGWRCSAGSGAPRP